MKTATNLVSLLITINHLIYTVDYMTLFEQEYKSHPRSMHDYMTTFTVQKLRET